MNRVSYLAAKLRLYLARNQANTAKKNLNRVIRNSSAAADEISSSYERFLAESRKQEQCAIDLKRIKNERSKRPLMKISLNTGNFTVLPKAAEKLTQFDVEMALTRHQNGDWGRVSEARWQKNNEAARAGIGKICSGYPLFGNGFFFVETDLAKEKTRVFLKEECSNGT